MLYFIVITKMTFENMDIKKNISIFDTLYILNFNSIFGTTLNRQFNIWDNIENRDVTMSKILNTWNKWVFKLS